jgi:hypothetical protein
MIEKLARTAEEATLELVLAELAERRSKSHEQDYVLRLFIKNAMLLGTHRHATPPEAFLRTMKLRLLPGATDALQDHPFRRKTRTRLVLTGARKSVETQELSPARPWAPSS